MLLQPHPQQTLYLICTKKVEYPPYLSSEAVDFLRSVLVRDPALRPTIPKMLEHVWIRRYACHPQFSSKYAVPLPLATQGTAGFVAGHSQVCVGGVHGFLFWCSKGLVGLESLEI